MSKVRNLKINFQFFSSLGFDYDRLREFPQSSQKSKENLVLVCEGTKDKVKQAGTAQSCLQKGSRKILV